MISHVEALQSIREYITDFTVHRSPGFQTFRLDMQVPDMRTDTDIRHGIAAYLKDEIAKRIWQYSVTDLSDHGWLVKNDGGYRSFIQIRLPLNSDKRVSDDVAQSVVALLKLEFNPRAKVLRQDIAPQKGLDAA